jgi:transposase-like protein
MKPEITTHRCCICGERKPLDQFLRDHTKKSGRGYRCYDCNRKYQAQRNARVRQILQEHKTANPLRDRYALAALAGTTPDPQQAIASAYQVADVITRGHQAP